MSDNHLPTDTTLFVQNILNGLSAHIAVVDEDGVIIAVNEAWRRFGLDNALGAEAGMVGANYLAVCDAAAGADAGGAAEFAAGMRDVIAGNQPSFQLEYPCHSPEEQRWFVARVTRFPEETGAARAIVAHENITARKLAEDRLVISQQRYRMLLNKASDAIFVCDLDGRILEANQVASRRLNYDLGEFRQLKMSDIDPIEFSRLQPNRMTQLALEGATLFETILISKDGRIIPTEMNVRYFDYDGQPTYLYVARDITGRKETIRAERESRKLAEALVDTAAIINSSHDLDQILQKVLANVDKVAPHDEAAIFLRDGRFATMVNVITQNGASQASANNRLTVAIADFPTFAAMVKSQQPLIVPDVTKYDGWVQVPDGQNSGAYLGAPIISDGELIGFINLSSRQPHTFSTRDADYLQAFANQTAIAIKNARLFSEVTALNTHLETQVQARTRQIEQQKEQLETIIYSSADKILLLDVDGRITLANPKFYDTFGLASDGVMGQLLTAVLPIKDKETLATKLENTIQQKATVSMETIATLPNGAKIDLEIRLAPVANGKISGLVCTMRNTSHFKKAARAKDTFVSNVSHELRTPISSISLYHELLRNKPDRLATYLPTLERETARLAKIVEDLLSLSRFDQNRTPLNVAAVNLNQIASDLINDRQSIAASRKISLEIGALAELPPLQADAGLLEQAISVLLTNAINYTPAGGRVWIDTLLDSQNGVNWCGISVCDTGPGVSLEDQTKIFERFFQGEAGQAARSSGTGLGLSIASEIVARHQGKIEVKSDGIPGAGSTFMVWLPTHN